ncbi:PP2C family protein-serine/threonine phosphatase [Planctomyces sp. SH-PL62]|uniref:PP2C family protein-serine/threonine phosphatase n=1 Tax=Planctomyces sp. SH-PL62 TaxID=1636152 RepID=UPI00078B6020|nr:PP2C family protein-serine/threonine phosphatase [Planctomyces sp. SH-PL62]AMV40730.1 Phosphoserine phosphatase RsbU [Planctomyces sp. SH-PL62]
MPSTESTSAATGSLPVESPPPAWGGDGSQARLAEVAEMMREMSTHHDPQEMVRSYGRRVRQIMPSDRWVSLSRRGLEYPKYRITRSSIWTEEVNPWKEPEKLPVLEGGLLAELIYGDEPRILDDISEILAPDEPAAEHLEGQRSLMAIPHFDQGVGLNMVVALRKEPGAWEPDKFPERFWISGLFGRATQNLVLNERLKQAYDVVDRELRVVADIQRSLLPKKLPAIPGVELATFYRTSQWAGGDYYDFFPLPDGRWGFMIADVSGHGTPAAVMMAILHSLVHGHPGNPDPPAALLKHVNDRLTASYTADNEVFVTAFYGIYDPATRKFTYACAGHNPPRIRRCSEGTVLSLEDVGGPPLGLFPDLAFDESSVTLVPGDVLVLYTDGVTEAMNARGDQFTLERLDAILGRCSLPAKQMVDAILDAVDAFTGPIDPYDDQTLVVAKVM